MRDGIPELKKVRVTSENKNAFKAPAGSEVREEVTIRRNGRISVKRFAYKKTKSEKEPELKVKSECTGQRILDTKSQKLDVKKINK